MATINKTYWHVFLDEAWIIVSALTAAFYLTHGKPVRLLDLQDPLPGIQRAQLDRDLAGLPC